MAFADGLHTGVVPPSLVKLADSGGQLFFGAAFVGPAQRPLLRGSGAGFLQAGTDSSAQQEPRGVATLGFLASSALTVGATAAAVGSRRRRLQRPQVARRQSAENQEEGPALLTDLGLDYSKLSELLKAKDFKAADAETRSMLIKMSGEEAQKRGWIYWAEVKSIPVKDMETLENLWQHYSEGKFGFARQRKVWQKCRGQFDKFAEEVSWFTDKWKNRNWPDEFIYTLEAPDGHLPLTNCIRGAQVLQELLEHPAIESMKAKPKSASKSSTSSTSSSTGKRKSALSMLASGMRNVASGPGPARLVGSQGFVRSSLQATPSLRSFNELLSFSRCVSVRQTESLS